MKLKEYNIVIALQDPDDEETEIKMTLGRVPRENVKTVKLPLQGLLEQFEESVE